MRNRLERTLVPLKRAIWAALVPWTPCMVTALRIALAPVIAYLLLYKLVGVAVALFFLAVFTDWLDGALARALRAESDLGAFLDATSDKVLILSALFAAGVALEPSFSWPWMSYMQALWALTAVEAALTAIRLPRLFSPRVNVHAGGAGKLKFAQEVIVVLGVMVLGSAELLPFAVGFGILSLVEHFLNYRPSPER